MKLRVSFKIRGLMIVDMCVSDIFFWHFDFYYFHAALFCIISRKKMAKLENMIIYIKYDYIYI